MRNKWIFISCIIAIPISCTEQDTGYNREAIPNVLSDDSLDPKKKPASEQIPDTKNPPTASNKSPFTLPIVPTETRIRDDFNPFFDEGTLILSDITNLQRTRPGQVNSTRYISLNFLNYLNLSDNEKINLKSEIINSISALTNSISSNNVITKPEPIDKEWSVLRIDIDDFNLNNAEWNFITANYPYRNSFNGPVNQIAQIINTQNPIVRGDWFANEIISSNKYRAILNLPANIFQLENALGINRINSIVDALQDKDGRRVSRIAIGANLSKKSPNNRLLERHESNLGSYWMSYDFGPQNGNQRKSLIQAPIGPGPNINDIQNVPAFNPDGHQAIFTLPNGLMGFYLANGNGNRRNFGNRNVIVNNKDIKNGGVVELGYSCFSCHGGGNLFKANDSLRGIMLEADNRDLPDIVIDGTLALHKSQSELNQLITTDSQKFSQSFEKTKLIEISQKGIMQSVGFYERNLKIDQIASELNLTQKQLENLVNRLPNNLQALLIAAKVSGVERETFEQNFDNFIREIFNLNQN